MPWRERLAAGLVAHWYRREPTLLVHALQPLAWLYRALWRLHARRAAPPRALPAPVVIVGNLVAGGAGKTPTVIALVRALQAAGWRPGVVSRGFGAAGAAPREVAPDAAPDAVGDEPLLIRRRTGVPVFVGRRRADAAAALCAAHPAVDVIVSDDGLQHHALPRCAEIVVFDERGVGNGRLLPAGPLRQPLPAEPPPLVLYNAPAPSLPWPGGLARRRLAGAAPLADWCRGAPFEPAALDALRGRTVAAAAGIAVPERFFAMLEAAGLHIERLALPDHHRFDTLPWPSGSADVLVTEKDAVKLDPARCGATRVWVVGLDFELPETLLQPVLQRLGAPRGAARPLRPEGTP